MLQMVRDITGVTDYGWNGWNGVAVEALIHVDFNACYGVKDKRYRRHHRS